MSKFKKVLIVRIINIAILAVFLYSNTAHPLPTDSPNNLRVPLNTTQRRQQKIQKRLILEKYGFSRLLTKEEAEEKRAKQGLDNLLEDKNAAFYLEFRDEIKTYGYTPFWKLCLLLNRDYLKKDLLLNTLPLLKKYYKENSINYLPATMRLYLSTESPARDIEYFISKIIDFIDTEELFNKVIDGFIKINDIDSYFSFDSAADIKEVLTKEEFKICWPDIIDLIVLKRNDQNAAVALIRENLRNTKEVFEKKFLAYWSDVIEPEKSGIDILQERPYNFSPWAIQEENEDFYEGLLILKRKLLSQGINESAAEDIMGITIRKRDNSYLKILNELISWADLDEDASRKIININFSDNDSEYIIQRHLVLRTLLASLIGEGSFEYDGGLVDPDILADMFVSKEEFKEKDHLYNYLQTLMVYLIHQKPFFETVASSTSQAEEWCKNRSVVTSIPRPETEDNGKYKKAIDKKITTGPLYYAKGRDLAVLVASYLPMKDRSGRYIIDPTQADRWTFKKTAQEDIDTLLKIDKHFSGNLAYHESRNLELFIESIKKGHLYSAMVNRSIDNENLYEKLRKKGSVRDLRPTKYVHFFINEVEFEILPEDYELGHKYAFVFPVELLLENRSFIHSPLHVRDWSVGGFSDDLLHDSHKIPIRSAVILAPYGEHGEEKEKLESTLRELEQTNPGWERPNKIFYYKGKGPEDGLRELREAYGLDYSRKDEIRISQMPRVYKRLVDREFKNDVIEKLPANLLGIKKEFLDVGIKDSLNRSQKATQTGI